MTKNKNKTIRVFALLGAILLSVFLVAMPFFVKTRNNNVTYADSFVDNPTFEGSFIPLQSVLFDRTGDVGFGAYNVLKNDLAFSFNSYSDRFVINNRLFNFSTWLSTTNGYDSHHFGYSEVLADVPIGLKTLTLTGLDNSSLSYSITSNNINNVGFDFTSFDITISKSSVTNFSLYFPYTYVLCDYNNVNTYYGDDATFIEIHGSTAFTIPSMLHIYYNDSYNVLLNGSKLFYCCTYHFIDSANNSIYISFPLDQNPSSVNAFSERTYYFHSDLSDSEFYNQGVNDGYNTGFADGDSNGYNRGYNTGYDVGESTGYNEGLQAGADVSFLNLIGATVDVPVKAFSGLFDFDVNMGGTSFNLKGFMLALLSVALVIAFIRIIMAK